MRSQIAEKLNSKQPDCLLTLYGLREDGSGYDPIAPSRLLPDLPLEVFCRYVIYHDQFDAVDEFLRPLGE